MPRRSGHRFADTDMRQAYVASRTKVRQPGPANAAASSARDDQALAGDDHPAAILPADRLDAAEARQRVARLDLDHRSQAPLDQRRAVVDAAHPPALEHGRP